MCSSRIFVELIAIQKVIHPLGRDSKAYRTRLIKCTGLPLKLDSDYYVSALGNVIFVTFVSIGSGWYDKNALLFYL